MNTTIILSPFYKVRHYGKEFLLILLTMPAAVFGQQINIVIAGAANGAKRMYDFKNKINK